MRLAVPVPTRTLLPVRVNPHRWPTFTPALPPDVHALDRHRTAQALDVEAELAIDDLFATDAHALAWRAFQGIPDDC